MRVIYSGRVQGVGFRYTAHRLASGFPIVGYVRNLSSGDVELVAEGPGEDVDRFLTALARQMAGYIEKADVQEEPPGNFNGFSIRH